jgi:hypothetical protein
MAGRAIEGWFDEHYRPTCENWNRKVEESKQKYSPH